MGHMRPLQWLLGKWESQTGEGFFSTIEPFKYNENVEFSNIGQPVINYSATSYHAGNGSPMHVESGFIRCHPDSGKIAFMTAHNFGVAMIEEGFMNEDGDEMVLESFQTSRMSFSKVPTVTQEMCGKTTDKYVEYEGTLVFIDLMLQKKEAYRHVLFNSSFTAYWKPLMLLLLFEAYRRWHQLRKPQALESYVELEWGFYVILIAVSLEFLMYLRVAGGLASQLSQSAYQREKSRRWRDGINALILASYGESFMVLGLLWDQDQDIFYFTFTTLFILVSHAQAFSVVSSVSSAKSLVIVTCLAASFASLDHGVSRFLAKLLF
ncbi:unnamed protein product [Darwinula stevensoni]|uniref:THAP4-like heme-binding domain-containing protein n=1 Tax=Darwinula stevensoni TaxID=69355 RepID=A0A7R9A4R8_9CRUS|nr:unnamed protein product [Darwinula stevensoni]CAG0890556.1 unnamed protein product [Darwinula stevensoni]